MNYPGIRFTSLCLVLGALACLSAPAIADFHEDFVKDKVLLVGCPKLDDAQYYLEKLSAMFKQI